MVKKLAVPADIEASSSAAEVLRVWVHEGSQRYALRVDLWNDPAAWGLVLADVARHAARAHALHTGTDEKSAMARIKAAFEAEWSVPTDDVDAH